MSESIREPVRLDALEREARSAQVVVFRSALTDTRSIINRLKRENTPYREVILGMADAKMRERFYLLSGMTGWTTLPQIFINGRFVGGEEEFLEHGAEWSTQRGGVSHPVASIASALGYGGLAPFVILAVLVWLPGESRLNVLSAQLLLAYGAVILAFIGAIHWGAALRVPAGTPFARPEMVMSVIPALAGWASLVLATSLAFPLQVLAFAGLYLYERFTAHRGILPAWYLGLRRRLTVIVLACLLTGAYAAQVYVAEATNGGTGVWSLDRNAGEPRHSGGRLAL